MSPYAEMWAEMAADLNDLEESFAFHRSVTIDVSVPSVGPKLEWWQHKRDPPSTIEDEPCKLMATQISKHIKKREWEDIYNLIVALPKNDARAVLHCVRTLSENRPKQKNVLHLICAKRPPRILIAEIVSKCPELQNETDLSGKTPLHVALKYGSPPCVYLMLGAMDQEKFLNYSPSGFFSFSRLKKALHVRRLSMS
eukprot:scaffold3237_cov55-Attheya_sp.AAC.7